MHVPASLAETVRRHDPDRFFCTLFAPAGARDGLFTLYAFNHELARAREVVSEPALALIRLHWWREVVEGTAKRHEVATPLTDLLAAGLNPEPLLRMIETREAQAEAPPETLAAFLAQMRDGPGALAEAAGMLLGAAPAALDRLRALGAAYGIAGTLRSMAALARQGRCVLPVDLLARAGLSPEAAIADPGAALAAVTPTLTEAGQTLLGRRERVPSGLIAAALPGALARRDLGRPMLAAPRGLGDRLAVLRAAVSRRV